MRSFLNVINIISLIVIFCAANCYIFAVKYPTIIWLMLTAFLLVNIFVGTRRLKASGLRFNICNHGGILLIIFALSVIMSVIYHIVLAFIYIQSDHMQFVWSAVTCVGVHFVLFWNGILCVYLCSYQLGVKLRLIGLLCGMIPIAHLIALKKIIFTVVKEIDDEEKRDKVNQSRKKDMVCKTKYPILLVHGVFFRDFKFFNYWGRIPGELKRNGAKIFYGKHHSATSVSESAEELTERIKDIVSSSGCGKLNVIAHSKGGLDIRYALSNLGAAPYIASLTTINTPHRGCMFADHLLKKAPASVKESVAKFYNKTYKRLGDNNPDFIAAVNDLTAEAAEKFNRELQMPDDIYCQSVGSILNKPESGKFPLNFTYHLVDYYNNPEIRNDGLVSENSFEWGEKYTLVTVNGDRGVSHGDMIDLNRENIKEFDVREFYVNLVNGLKNKGL